MTQPNNPMSGRRATKEDFEDSLGLSLQDMLNLTSNHALNCNDAWAEGNTDAAFAINNFVGVQRSHKDNDWNYGWVDLANQGHGTYVYLPGDAYLIQNLTVPKIDKRHVASIPVTNSTSSPVTTGVKYTETELQSTTITDSWKIGLKVTTDFTLFGHKFGFEASFEKGNTEANTKTTTTSSEFTATVAVPANANYELDVYQETTTQTCLYGLDVALGSDHPQGSLGKATYNQGIWDTFFRIEDVLKGREKQTAKYQIVVTTS
jgi:hypothetical protein